MNFARPKRLNRFHGQPVSISGLLGELVAEAFHVRLGIALFRQAVLEADAVLRRIKFACRTTFERIFLFFFRYICLGTFGGFLFGYL